MEEVKLPELPTDNIMLFDWLSFTSRYHDFYSIVHLMGLDDVQWTDTERTHNCYRRGMMCDYMYIYWDHPKEENAGVWVELTGKGCRAFESYSKIGLESFIYIIRDNPEVFHVARLDVAFDDHTDIFSMKKMIKDLNELNYVSQFRDRKLPNGSYAHNSITIEYHPGHEGYTINCGSKSSMVFFRIYDKAYERGYDLDVHWIRFEMMLRNDHAMNFIKQLTDVSVGKLFRDVVINYFRFVTPSKSDTNKRRWEIRPYWKRFLGEAEAVSLTTKCTKDYNLAACERYVYKIGGNSIATVIQIKGVEVFLQELKLNKPVMSEKYKGLINSNECIKDDPILKYIQERKKEK